MELWLKNAFLNRPQTSNLLLAYEKYSKGNPCLWPHNKLFVVLGGKKKVATFPKRRKGFGKSQSEKAQHEMLLLADTIFVASGAKVALWKVISRPSLEQGK